MQPGKQEGERKGRGGWVLVVGHITCVEQLEAWKISYIQGTFYGYGDSLTEFASGVVQ